jgi:hypothetical protein
MVLELLILEGKKHSWIPWLFPPNTNHYQRHSHFMGATVTRTCNPVGLKRLKNSTSGKFFSSSLSIHGKNKKVIMIKAVRRSVP